MSGSGVIVLQKFFMAGFRATGIPRGKGISEVVFGRQLPPVLIAALFRGVLAVSRDHRGKYIPRKCFRELYVRSQSKDPLLIFFFWPSRTRRP